MAKKASAAGVAADMRPPNFRSAVQTIRHAITKKKEKISGINGEIAGEWGKIEGFHVNKKAGQIFASLDKLEHVERVDIMRSLNGLIDAAEWDKEIEDLADRAEGNVVHMNFPGGTPAGEGGGDTLENGEDAEIAAVAEEVGKSDAAEAAKATVGKKAGLAKDKLAGLDAARGHLSGEAPKDPAYTGDNSDLAGEENSGK